MPCASDKTHTVQCNARQAVQSSHKVSKILASATPYIPLCYLHEVRKKRVFLHGTSGIFLSCYLEDAVRSPCPAFMCCGCLHEQRCRGRAPVAFRRNNWRCVRFYVENFLFWITRRCVYVQHSPVFSKVLIASADHPFLATCPPSYSCGWLTSALHSHSLTVLTLRFFHVFRRANDGDARQLLACPRCGCCILTI